MLIFSFNTRNRSSGYVNVLLRSIKTALYYLWCVIMKEIYCAGIQNLKSNPNERTKRETKIKSLWNRFQKKRAHFFLFRSRRRRRVIINNPLMWRCYWLFWPVHYIMLHVSVIGNRTIFHWRLTLRLFYAQNRFDFCVSFCGDFRRKKKLWNTKHINQN